MKNSELKRKVDFMSLISNLLENLDRSSAGSEETASAVMGLCGEISAKAALFAGDEFFTPVVIKNALGANAEISACFFEQSRADRAAARGFNTRVIMPFEIPENEGGWDFIWFNTVSALFDTAQFLEQLKSRLNGGGTAVFRRLCYLIEPSPDTKSYAERRFGRLEPLDETLRTAKEAGFKIRDFYIAPRSDWTKGLYEPLKNAMNALGGDGENGENGEERSGVSEINKEIYMFELHSEEYSFVYYILNR